MSHNSLLGECCRSQCHLRRRKYTIQHETCQSWWSRPAIMHHYPCNLRERVRSNCKCSWCCRQIFDMILLLRHAAKIHHCTWSLAVYLGWQRELGIAKCCKIIRPDRVETTWLMKWSVTENCHCITLFVILYLIIHQKFPQGLKNSEKTHFFRDLLVNDKTVGSSSQLVTNIAHDECWHDVNKVSHTFSWCLYLDNR